MIRPACACESSPPTCARARLTHAELHRHGVFHQGYQHVLRGCPAAGVTQHDRYLAANRHGFPDVLDRVREVPVEAVEGDDERQARRLEVVDRRERVRKPAGVDKYYGSDRTLNEVIPHEPEPVLAGGPEQVEHKTGVERDPAEVP